MTREPVAPELYRNVFENYADGQRVLEDLVARFGNVRFVSGGPEAAREQDRMLGEHRVVNFVLSMINRAHGIDEGGDGDHS